MRVLVTGASSGIGLSISKYFDNLGWEVVMVSRDIKKLKTVSKDMKNVHIEAMDLGDIKNCYKLFDTYKNIDVLINNAGFGLFGNFYETSLDKEIDMINLNITSLHVLCKLYLGEFVKRDSGYILNVGSIAGFMPGPLMGTYYASKNYVVKLSLAIREELRKKGSNVYVGVLCPGPVKTNFDNVAGVKFSLNGLDSDYVASYTIRKMFKRKKVIIPGVSIKLLRFVSKIVPDSIMVRFVYMSQRRKK